MDDAYREKLRVWAKSIAKLQELDDEELHWLKPLLSKGVQSTMDLLKLIGDRPMTFEEVAIELDINQCTVTQKLNALLEGGYPLTLTDKTAFAETGRPRKLARKAGIREKLLQLIQETD